MKIGDLVRNLNSESGMTGVIVDMVMNSWEDDFGNSIHPVVIWADGRQGWVQKHRVEVVNDKNR